jgi:hypothetical protein
VKTRSFEDNTDFPQSHLASAQLGDKAYTLALAMPVMRADWVLHKVAHFEVSLATYSLEPEVTSVSQRELFYHEALPMSGGELRWLSQIALFIPRVARKLSRADERVVERAMAEANARYNARQKHVGTAALMSIPEISTESISTTP